MVTYDQPKAATRIPREGVWLCVIGATLFWLAARAYWMSGFVYLGSWQSGFYPSSRAGFSGLGTYLPFSSSVATLLLLGFAGYMAYSHLKQTRPFPSWVPFAMVFYGVMGLFNCLRDRLSTLSQSDFKPAFFFAILWLVLLLNGSIRYRRSGQATP